MTRKVSLPPKNNDKMRINFYRIDRRDNVSSPDLYAWSPTMNGSYHTPSKFGYIVFSTVVPTGISPMNNGLSESTVLHSLSVKAVEKNPGTVRISYFVPSRSAVSLKICTLSGQTVRVLETSCQASGPHETVWDCRDYQGRQVLNGAYAAILQAGKFRIACAFPLAARTIQALHSR
jgi:hypothetical protein